MPQTFKYLLVGHMPGFEQLYTMKKQIFEILIL